MTDEQIAEHMGWPIKDTDGVTICAKGSHPSRQS